MPSDFPYSDSDLVAKLLAGDEATFESLLSKYHVPLFRLALVFVPNRASAEEVVQDTWVAVLDGLKNFEGRSSLKTWIFSILTNRAKTTGIRQKRSVNFSALSQPDLGDDPAVDPARFSGNGMWIDPPLLWNQETPEKLMLEKETLKMIEDQINRLPETQRTVILMRDVEGFQSDEICNILEISETNQRVLLHRARSKIREALEEHLRGM